MLLPPPPAPNAADLELQRRTTDPDGLVREGEIEVLCKPVGICYIREVSGVLRSFQLSARQDLEGKLIARNNVQLDGSSKPGTPTRVQFKLAGFGNCIAPTTLEVLDSPAP